MIDQQLKSERHYNQMLELREDNKELRDRNELLQQ